MQLLALRGSRMASIADRDLWIHCSTVVWPALWLGSFCSVLHWQFGAISASVRFLRLLALVLYRMSFGGRLPYFELCDILMLISPVQHDVPPICFVFFEFFIDVCRFHFQHLSHPGLHLSQWIVLLAIISGISPFFHSRFSTGLQKWYWFLRVLILFPVTAEFVYQY